MHSNSRQHPVLSLPIETKSREFLGKLMLASLATERGWSVILGNKSRIGDILPKLPAAMHIEISIPEAKLAKRLQPYLDAGHQLACLCEEGIMYPDGRDYCQRKVGQAALSTLSRYFANGSRQADHILQNRSPAPSTVLVTGNPRFDLLHQSHRAVYERSVQRITSSIGSEFVLVNTNFTLINPHPAYGDRIENMRRTGRIATPEQEQIWADLAGKQRQLLHDYQRLVQELDRRGHTVVVRPHPSENAGKWKAFTAKMKNVHVTQVDSANPWMLAALVVVHSGCTTGLEAHLLDRRVIAYVADSLIDADSFINKLDIQESTVEGVIQAIDLIKNQGRHEQVRTERNPEIQAALLDRIENVARAGACERILNALDTIQPAPQSLALIRQKLRETRSSLRSRITTAVTRRSIGMAPQWMYRTPLGKRLSRCHLQQQKFPGISEQEIISASQDFYACGLISATPRIEKIEADLYLLSAAEKRKPDGRLAP